MSLSDKLNQALAAHKLQPVPRTRTFQTALGGPVLGYDLGEEQPKMYLTLEDGIKAAKSIEPDDFGTRVVVVEKVNGFNQLPMAMGQYIVDDIQKRAGGGYEVHLVEKSKR
jgi:hypothetical protein